MLEFKTLSPSIKTSTLNPVSCFASAFGLFLGLCTLKFGNPVILDQKITPPANFYDFLTDFWPPHWAIWVWLPFAVVGGFLILTRQNAAGTAPVPGAVFRVRAENFVSAEKRSCANILSTCLWLLPLIWLGWQLISAANSVDSTLTASTLPEFIGCVGCYFLGAFLLGRTALLPWLLAGVLLAFTFCLMRGVEQRLFEFPQSYQVLMEGQNSQWTNLPPQDLLEMKQANIIVNTNGMDVANPMIMAKFAKGRVNGTLVYPNALAGIILLLLPIALGLAFNTTKKLKPLIRGAVIALTIGLGGAAFFFTGSKLGWLLAIALGGLMLFRLDWSARLKWMTLAIILTVGLGVFTIRFHKYFAAGATSAGARFDYWRAAAQTTESHPLLGTGPGTFQRPYARLKSPNAEMARLTHNDYLEQFSDSGVIGGISYLAWITLTLVFCGRRLWRRTDYLSITLFAGVLAWFIQGLGEFSLYIPALAWTAFTLLGCLVSLSAIEFDKKPAFR